MTPTPCTPCCTTPQTVNVPGIEGVAGTNGTSGTNGSNAYTVTTMEITVPATPQSIGPVTFASTAWMVVGQIIIIGQGLNVLANPGPAHFRVTSILSSTTAVLYYLGYSGDVAGTVISVGATVVGSGTQPTVALDRLSVYAAGTAYQLTATSAKLVFGTTSPSLTLTTAGTWLLLARVRYDFVGATFAASRTVTTALCHNTGVALTHGSSSWQTPTVTLASYTARMQSLPPVLYTTAVTTDVIELWASVGVVPSAGSLNAVEAEIVAIRVA